MTSDFEKDYELNYPRFTKDMVKDHTILIPSMLDIHFRIFEKALTSAGYKCELLKNVSDDVKTEGLKYVHNDTCYPALLVIGQFIDALNHRNDTHNVVLLITQTGGGCRASNYIHLLRKALVKAGYEYVPVVSLNASNLEKDSGLQINLPLIKKLSAAMTYGDFITYLKNKTISYEVNKGETMAVVDKYVSIIEDEFNHNKGTSFHTIKKHLKEIASSFDNIPLTGEVKPKVGIVGEIYIKYSPLGNNHLEEFLVSEGAEVESPGLFGFIYYTFYNGIYDKTYYKTTLKSYLINKFLIHYLNKREAFMIKAIKKTKFKPMNRFKHTKELCNGILSHGTKMGEGWLLTAEMIELVESGYSNIICAQPFGCLPNHICGKGVMKTIKHKYPDANIIAVDYDPSQTKVNQENRIKLMLAIARENINQK